MVVEALRHLRFGPKFRGSFRPRYVALYDRGSVLYDLTARDPRRGAKLRHALAGGWEVTPSSVGISRTVSRRKNATTGKRQT